MVADLIVATLNEDVSYSTQPIELRSQRVYAIKVTNMGDVVKSAIADVTRLASTASSMLQDRRTRRRTRMLVVSGMT